MSKTINRVWMFDADGVLTDPQEKRVTETEIFKRMTTLLQQGEFITINSGRSIEWIQEHIIQPLQSSLDDSSLLGRFFVVGEKGGAWSEFNIEQAQWHTTVDQALSVPEDLRSAVYTMIQRSPYTEIMFQGEVKRSMISPEMRVGTSHELYKQIQTDCAKKCEALLEQYQLQRTHVVDVTGIAIDIQHCLAGKDLGAERIVDWLQEQGIQPEHFEAVGDSPSDFAMADKLHELGFSVHFTYVGDKTKIPTETKPYPVTTTTAEYHLGTAEYLKQPLARTRR